MSSPALLVNLTVRPKITWPATAGTWRASVELHYQRAGVTYRPSNRERSRSSTGPRMDCSISKPSRRAGFGLVPVSVFAKGLGAITQRFKIGCRDAGDEYWHRCPRSSGAGLSINPTGTLALPWRQRDAAMALGGDPKQDRRNQARIEISQFLATMDTNEKSPDYPLEVRMFLAELGEAVQEYLEQRRGDGTGDCSGEVMTDGVVAGVRDESGGIFSGE